MSEFDTIIEGMHFGISKHLMDKHFTILWANRYAYEMTGYTKDEFSNRYHNKIDEYYKKDRETFDRVMKVIEDSYNRKETVCRFECPVKSKRGAVAWVQINGMFSNEKYRGIPIIWSVFYDITDTLEAQKELVQKTEKLNSELQKVDKMKQLTGEFLEELSRDVRSLVNIITGMADVAELYLTDQTTCENCLKNIRRTSSKLKKKILDARRIFHEEAS
ncbi:PAS domain S-box protein [Hungatella sp. L12]|uniref:PAS domain S-box protein n=1 Tax=Hungatella hominis TaxID=2763050 RepID=A0ABR7H4R6_9FIRM|nr:PAS domain S-box protein [Hungatella hominis]MBC5708204.1 PAS domain S-box protein [Hungatella hominis]